MGSVYRRLTTQSSTLMPMSKANTEYPLSKENTDYPLSKENTDYPALYRRETTQSSNLMPDDGRVRSVPVDPHTIDAYQLYHQYHEYCRGDNDANVTVECKDSRTAI